MDQPLDIFRIVAEGVHWIGSAENLEAAKGLIKAKSAEQPGDFLVVSLETGWKSRLRELPPKTHSAFRPIAWRICERFISPPV